MSAERSRGPAQTSRTPRNGNDVERSAEANGTDRPGAALLIGALGEVMNDGLHWVTRCPCHDDTEASLIVDVKASKWPPHQMTVLVFCPVCHASLTDVCATLGVDVTSVLNGNERLRKQKSTPFRRPLDPYRVSVWQAHLHERPDALRYLVKVRALHPATIERHRIGLEASDRYTLPVYVEDELVNVRRYLPDAPPGRKMLNTTGYGSPARLYPALLPSGPVVVCEGEWDALVLGQHRLPFSVVTSTHGAATFLDEWVPLLRGRHVAFLYDCDPAGRLNSQQHAARVASAARSVRVVDLDPERDDGWDVSDWFKEGRSAHAIRGLIRATAPLGVR